jgi:hypothetical protein
LAEDAPRLRALDATSFTRGATQLIGIHRRNYNLDSQQPAVSVAAARALTRLAYPPAVPVLAGLALRSDA